MSLLVREMVDVSDTDWVPKAESKKWRERKGLELDIRWQQTDKGLLVLQYFPNAASSLIIIFGKSFRRTAPTLTDTFQFVSANISLIFLLFPHWFLLISLFLFSYFSVSYLVKGLGGRFQPQLTHSSLFPRRGGLSDTRPGALASATKALEEIFQEEKGNIFRKNRKYF